MAAVETAVVGSPPRPPARRLQTRVVLQWAVIGIPVVLFLVLAWKHRWTFEDGFINFRIVRQIQAGHGPVFNSGQRVEAFTSPLWILVLWLGDLVLPLPLEWVAAVLGIGAAVAGLAMATAGSFSLVRARSTNAFIVPVGALVVAVLSPMWYFASSGLEMGLVFCWIGASCLLLARWAREQQPLGLWSGFVLGLAWLVRPELGLMTLALFAAVVVGEWSDTSWKRRLALFGAVVSAPLAYQVFRMGYFATIFPNTAYAKDASGSSWSRGWDYAVAFSDRYALWIPIVLLVLGAFVPLIVGAARSQRRVALFYAGFLVAALLDAVYVIRVGGDYMPARLLLPAVFALCAPVAVLPLRARVAAAYLTIPWVVVCILVYRPHWYDYLTTIGMNRPNLVTLEQAQAQDNGLKLGWFHPPGLYDSSHRIEAQPGPDVSDATIIEGGVGLIGYAAGPNVDILDPLGLADPVTAHFALVRRGYPGHEKPAPAVWLAARLTAPGSKIGPRDFKPFDFLAPLIPQTTGSAFQGQVAQVRKAVGCGDLKRLRDSYRGRLTVGRFFTNIVDSVGLSRVTVPPDPAKAVAKFCGTER